MRRIIALLLLAWLICLAFFYGRKTAMIDCQVTLEGPSALLELDGNLYIHNVD